MTTSDIQKIETIFHSALEHEPAKRSAFLDTACGDDELLRQKVDAPFGAPLIHTVRGVGYTLRAP